MSLLLDANLSYRMLAELRESFPGVTHVREHGLMTASDMEIWSFAHDRGLAIVTRDFDFIERSLVERQPPKVVRLATGNTSRQAALACILRNSGRIRDLIDDPNQLVLEIT